MWFDVVRSNKENRGIMAALKYLLYENKRVRAWPILHRMGIDIQDRPKTFIASLFAIHPVESDHQNFGETCRLIMIAKDRSIVSGDDEKSDHRLDSLEKRFMLLVSSDTQEELFDRALRMVFLAKNVGIGINYESLFWDIKYWGDKVKEKWACSFWFIQNNDEELQ